MKKFAGISIFFLFLVLAISLTAGNVDAQLSASKKFGEQEPTFGSDSQEASNPKGDDPSKSNIRVENTINLVNANASPINIVSIKVTNIKSPFTTEKLEIQPVDVLPKSISATGGNIKLRARIPEELDAINKRFEEVAVQVATVELLDEASDVIGTVDVWMQRENQLRIKDLDATINDKGKQSVDDKDNIEKIKPGDRVELELEAANEFDDETNLDIENVDLSIACTDESNFDFDDKTQSMGDIGTEDEETETISFDVEEDAKDDDTNCEVTVDGEDENKARHGALRSFGIEVVRSNHDLVIKALNANPNSLSCADTTINLRADYINLGRSDEDRVAIEVTSKILGYQERVAGLSLDEDDTDEKTFLVSVDPRQIKQGPFVFQIQTFFDNTKLSDTATLTMDNLCSEAEPPTTGNKKTTNGGTIGTTNALVVGSETISLKVGSLASIPVKVINQEDVQVEYTISLTNTEDFAEGSASKQVFLNPGQESTVFLNLKAKDNVAEGMYSGTITLKNKKGDILETRTFTVEVTGTSSGGGLNFGSLFGGGDSNSKVFWIIGDIILIIVAIFFIKLIFTGGRRKAAGKPVPKRMADYEADAATRRKR